MSRFNLRWGLALEPEPCGFALQKTHRIMLLSGGNAAFLAVKACGLELLAQTGGLDLPFVQACDIGRLWSFILTAQRLVLSNLDVDPPAYFLSSCGLCCKLTVVDCSFLAQSAAFST